MGDPDAEETELGPLARHDLRDELHQQVRESVAAGARCSSAARCPTARAPSIRRPCSPESSKGMPASDEELFGPVAAILEAEDDEHAVRIANDSPFGLGAAVFTRDLAKGERIARTQLEAGCCFVNDFVRSDPRLPFGGVRSRRSEEDPYSCGKSFRATDANVGDLRAEADEVAKAGIEPPYFPHYYQRCQKPCAASGRAERRWHSLCSLLLQSSKARRMK